MNSSQSVSNSHSIYSLLKKYDQVRRHRGSSCTPVHDLAYLISENETVTWHHAAQHHSHRPKSTLYIDWLLVYNLSSFIFMSVGSGQPTKTAQWAVLSERDIFLIFNRVQWGSFSAFGISGGWRHDWQVAMLAAGSEALAVSCRPNPSNYCSSSVLVDNLTYKCTIRCDRMVFENAIY